MSIRFNYISYSSLLFIIAASSYAEEKYPTVADNWCKQAESNLTTRSGAPITCESVKKRCVKMNNYWCQKHGRDPWKGTSNHEGKDGNRDSANHAIFQSVEWSARAIAIDIRTKYMNGYKTAVQIAAQYSPWCDTLGSFAVSKEGSGRTCKDEGASPPASFTGPLCKTPSSHNPTVSDCISGCNCPPEIAVTLVKGLPTGVNDDLKLFNNTGKPQPNLNVILRNLAIQEQGIYIRPTTIERGIIKLSN